jgi:tRNA dimethylallyltransferase
MMGTDRAKVQPARPLVVILGATAVGKSALGLALAQQFGGEIVSADSRQIYRGMDIGTAKPTPAEQAVVPHHLLDLCTPDYTLTLAEYQQAAYATIDALHARGRLPILVGGTVLYVRAVVEGLRIPVVPPDPLLRAELEAFLAQEGRAALYARLAAVDPLGAAAVDRQNPRRVLRALEIFLATGKSKVELEGADPPPFAVLQIGLMRPRPALYARIDARVVAMVEAGLAAETARLLAAGYGATLPAMTSLGYREMRAYLRGEMTLDAAVERIQVETHRYVRHQDTWFRKLSGVQWFDLGDADADDALEQVAATVAQFLAEHPLG